MPHKKTNKISDKSLIDVSPASKPDESIIAPEFATTTESFDPITDIPTANIQPEQIPEDLKEVAQVESRLEESGVLNADLIAAVKQQVTAEILADLKEDNVLKAKETEMRRELEDIEYNNYVAMKMESDDPWVDFVGEVRDTEKGQRLEMNWNDAFIVFLKSIGITGLDEEQMVQKYISLLLQDMVDKSEDRYGSDYQ